MTTDAQLGPLPGELRRWSRAELDLPPEKSSAADRRALLAQLREMDFIPTPDWDSALRLAGFAPWEDVNGPIILPARRAWEEALRAEVEEFASRFFSMPGPTRAARFHELLSRCVGAPAIIARLEGLRPALALPCELPAKRSVEITELLEEIRRLFVLPRQARASSRRAFVTRSAGDPAVWRQSAEFVRGNYIRYAALEPALLRELATSPIDRERKIAKLAGKRQRAVRRASAWKTSVRIWRKADLIAGRAYHLFWKVSLTIFAVLFGIGLLATLAERDADTQSGSRLAPRPAAPGIDFEKLNREMNQDINERLRRGEHIGEAMRRLYGLPPESPGAARSPAAPPDLPKGSLEEPGDRSRKKLLDGSRNLDDQPSLPESPEQPPP